MELWGMKCSIPSVGLMTDIKINTALCIFKVFLGTDSLFAKPA